MFRLRSSDGVRELASAARHVAPGEDTSCRAGPGPDRAGHRAGMARDRRGSVAVEFALLAVPFLGLVYGIFETSMVHMTGQVMQTAVTDASRLIMTGQAQKNGLTATQFKAEICRKITAFFNCARDLQVDVQVYTSFTGASVTKPPIDAKGNLDTTAFKYDAGQPNSIVIVRAVVAYPIIVPLIGKTMVNLAGNKLLIMATAAFKNEPYVVGS
jgi:Flp pilus assembly protein TadG